MTTDTPAGARPAPVLRRRSVRLLAGVATAVLALDLITKITAVATLEDRPPIAVIDGFLYLTLLRNPGAAWSMASGYTWALTVIAVVVIGVIVRIARRLASTGWAVGLGMILGGALGNLIDRLFRAPGPMRGHVVDMLAVFSPDGSIFPVFNIADPGIVGGGLLLAMMALRGIEIDGTRPE